MGVPAAASSPCAASAGGPRRSRAAPALAAASRAPTGRADAQARRRPVRVRAPRSGPRPWLVAACCRPSHSTSSSRPRSRAASSLARSSGGVLLGSFAYRAGASGDGDRLVRGPPGSSPAGRLFAPTPVRGCRKPVPRWLPKCSGIGAQVPWNRCPGALGIGAQVPSDSLPKCLWNSHATATTRHPGNRNNNLGLRLVQGASPPDVWGRPRTQ